MAANIQAHTDRICAGLKVRYCTEWVKVQFKNKLYVTLVCMHKN